MNTDKETNIAEDEERGPPTFSASVDFRRL
jgi:hypothetical protein